MSYHTFETSFKITKIEYSIYKDFLYKFRKRVYKDKDTIISEALKDNGIIIKLHKSTKSDYTNYTIYYRINPRRVFEEKNFIGIFDPEDTDKMIKRVNKLLGKLPQLEICNIRRIDFCANIRLKSQQDVKDYLKIVKRCAIPPKFKMNKYYDKKAKKHIVSQNGITITGSNDLEITLYNKYRQLKEQKIDCPDIEDANNIIRLEIRCGYKKLQHLREKFNVRSLEEFLNSTNKIFKYLLSYYLPSLFGSGSFFKLDDIKEKLKSAPYKEKNYKAMIRLAEKSATHSSLDKTLSNLGKKDIQNLMKKFNEQNISPIVLPRRFEADYLPNPISLALESIGYK